jgi:hypothetical protein
VIREIIATCSKYRNNVFFELDEKERKQSVEAAKLLLNGEITLKQLFRLYADIQYGER